MSIVPALATNTMVIAALIVGVLVVCYVVWHVAIAVDRAAGDRHVEKSGAVAGPAPEIEPRPDTGSGTLQDYREAHTLIHLDPETGASVTLNISKIDCRSSVDYTFTFLQPIEPASLRVRLLADTPPMQVLSCDGYQLQARFAEPPETIKLRILGQLIPLIRNNFPDGAPAQAAAAGASISPFRLH